MLRMMLVSEIHGQVKALQTTALVSPEDVRRKYSHPLSIERKANEISKKLPRRRQYRTLSHSVEVRKTPSPTLPPVLNRPFKQFKPVLQGRKSPDLLLRRVEVQPVTPAGLSLKRLYMGS